MTSLLLPSGLLQPVQVGQILWTPGRALFPDHVREREHRLVGEPGVQPIAPGFVEIDAVDRCQDVDANGRNTDPEDGSGTAEILLAKAIQRSSECTQGINRPDRICGPGRIQTPRSPVALTRPWADSACAPTTRYSTPCALNSDNRSLKSDLTRAVPLPRQALERQLPHRVHSLFRRRALPIAVLGYRIAGTNDPGNRDIPSKCRPHERIIGTPWRLVTLANLTAFLATNTLDSISAAYHEGGWARDVLARTPRKRSAGQFKT